MVIRLATKGMKKLLEGARDNRLKISREILETELRCVFVEDHAYLGDGDSLENEANTRRK